MKLEKKLYPFLLACSLLIYSNLSAQTVQVLSSPGELSPNVTNVRDTYVLQVYFHENRSYECAIFPNLFIDRPQNDPDNYWVFTNFRDKNSEIVPVSPNGNIFPQAARIGSFFNTFVFSDENHASTRVSLTAPNTGLYKTAISAFVGAGNTASASFKCRETTLYGAYNRFFAQTAIAEIQNKAFSDFTITVTIKDAQGNIVLNKQQYLVNANTRTDIIFSNIPANNYGQIVINHTAPFGALSGVIAEYDQTPDGQIILKRERPLQTAKKN